ncbi:MazG nucleotide pyrophosphohydrolase domain-containing protein [Lapillicoccus jejuensis]|uniref:XTP/dITP diphosphohydrolase n=1 Tax=Lapillicoccus jejuensis TaxID=402171 RepID=A0A542E1J3_9MICO|nr:MazG nucleotide pyrophosphohydrolase domain-containing protein [Lapillicoccus jejuensis]TQJ09202.1 XTP/dITP diphosphohydrolase [Lapillicoccus jejuensis]
MSGGRLTLLLTSPRLPAGLLTREAWQVLEAADEVLGHPDEPQVAAVTAAGLSVADPASAHPDLPLGRDLVARADGRAVVWVGSSDADPGLTDTVAAEVTRLVGAGVTPPDVEVLVGSWDPPGARVLDLVAVMDRLRSPGGCPWDAQQTPSTLVPYLVEEAHEAVEAIEAAADAEARGAVPDRVAVVEELGDVLLQVAFHARVGEEHPHTPFDLDDVADAIVTKLVRRHPHVFAVDGSFGSDAADAGAVEANWEQIKAGEKAARGDGDTGPLAGVPAGLPPLARATKVVSRLRRRDAADLLDGALTDDDPAPTAVAGRRLLSLVAELEADGVDPDQALRGVLRTLDAAATRPGPPDRDR